MIFASYTAQVLDDGRIAQETGITGAPTALLHYGAGQEQAMLPRRDPRASLEAAVERASRQSGT